MTQALESIKICGFRGIQEIELTDLGTVNILVGDNNSGKTSILEAIALFSNPLDPFQWLTTAQRRSYLGKFLLTPHPPNIEVLKWLFYQTNHHGGDDVDQREMTIEAVNNSDLDKLTATLSEIYGTSDQYIDEEEMSENFIETESESIQSGIELDVLTNLKSAQLPLNLDLEQPKPIKKTFTFWENERFRHRRNKKFFIRTSTILPTYTSSDSMLVSLISRLIKQGDYHISLSKLIEIIKEFDNNIIDLRITDNKSLYVEHKELGSAPLYIFGDGLKRALLLALTILSTDDGVLMIDEVETSIHISAFKKLFYWLVKTCDKRNIQLFLTTHSLEVIDAILQTDINLEHLVTYHLSHLKKPPKRFSGELLQTFRSELGLEVR
ncbi:MAG: ATP/GTP-binding protein [Microcystaceae cyanobacterium]